MVAKQHEEVLRLLEQQVCVVSFSNMHYLTSLVESKQVC